MWRHKPQAITFVPGRATCAHRARLLLRQPNDGIRVRFEVAPPRRIALVPAIHRDRDEVRTVFEVADDDGALFPGCSATSDDARKRAEHRADDSLDAIRAVL